MRRGGEGTRADEERGGATLPGSGRRADRCAWPEGECPQTTDPAPPTGLISPKNVQIGYKGLSLRRPHERKPWNHAVVFRPDECDPSLCIRFGHPRLLPGSCAGSQRRSMGASPPEGPRATRSVRRAGGRMPGPRANGHVAKTVDSSRVRARARPGAAGPAGHAWSAPGRVSPQGPPARLRPGGRGPHRARSGSAEPGPRRAPTAPGSPPKGRSPPQDAARRPPAPHGPAHS